MNLTVPEAGQFAQTRAYVRLETPTGKTFSHEKARHQAGLFLTNVESQ
jgi:hypothetical protein